MKKRLDVIGKSRRRVDGRAKVTGALRYADDLSLPRMLHAKLLRSPHPHAVIEKIDVARAKKHPGVQVTGEPGTLCWTELSSRDTNASEKFYTQLFGWTAKRGGAGPTEYTEFHSAR